jgi:hypothetical protein
MEAIFTLQYPEFAVAERLKNLLRQPKGRYSITVPLSRQQRGWDLLAYSEDTNGAARVQVKSSRDYGKPGPSPHDSCHLLWMNNFRLKLEFADFFVLFGVYPTLDECVMTDPSHNPHWARKTLIFTRNEMASLLPSSNDPFFYVRFEESGTDRVDVLDGRKRLIAELRYDDFRPSARGDDLKHFLESGSCTDRPIHILGRRPADSSDAAA